MVIKKGVFFKKRDEYDTNLVLCPLSDYNRDSYISKRLLIRTLSAMTLAFFFGYFIYYTLNSVSSAIYSVLLFIVSFIVSFYILQLPHELLKILFYPSTFNTNSLELYFFHKKRLVISLYKGKLSTTRILLSSLVPFILLSLLPIITLSILGFNFFLYAMLTANIILCAEDFLNIILVIFRSEEDLYIYEL